MVLMNVLDAGNFLHAAHRVLRPGGALIATLTHPCFWPVYKGYDSEPWFDYSQETLINAPFTISLEEKSDFSTTHVHRPLSQYLTSAVDAGFEIHEVREPLPNPVLMAKYPTTWKYPRYIAIKLVKKSGPLR